MSGFILKDLYIMRKRIILNIGFLLSTMILLDILAGLLKNMVPKEDINVISAGLAIMVSICAFMVLYSLECDILFTDERRKWNAYSAASEAGVRAVVGAKYTLCFIISFLGYLICRFNDIVLSLIFDRTVQLSMFYLGLVFSVTLLMAVQLSFGIRFGAKYGTNLRLALFIGIFVLGAIYAMFGDVDWLMGEGGVRDNMRYLLEHLDDAGVKDYLAKLSGGAVAVLSLIPHAIVGMYWLSYRSSCKTYTRGAENYDK